MDCNKLLSWPEQEIYRWTSAKKESEVHPGINRWKGTLEQLLYHFHYLLGLKLQCKHNFKQFIFPTNSKYISIVKSQAPKLRLCYSQKETMNYNSMQEPQAGRDERIL